MLARLDELGPSSISVLAEAEHVRQQSLGRTVDSLVDKGWVSRHRDEGDRRRVRVALTAQGRAALGRGHSLRQTWLSTAIATDLDDAEGRQLAAGLALLERLVERGAPRT